MASKWTVFIVSACLSGLLSTGCAEGKEEFIAKARREARNQNYEEAVKLFEKVLEVSPDDYNALWGIADVHQREGNLVKQASMLEKIMADEQMAKDYAGVVKPALEENYNKQGMLMAGADRTKSEEFYRKAIKINKKSEANQGLFKLLSGKGDSALKKKEFKTAAEAFTAAGKLRISRKDRAKVKGKAEIAEFFAFKEDFQPRFDKLKQGLIDEKIYIEAERMFVLPVRAEIDTQGEKKPDYTALVKAQRKKMVIDALSTLTWRIAEKERPEGAYVNYANSVWDVVQRPKMEKAGRKMFYSIGIAVAEDAVFEQVANVDKGETKNFADAPVTEEKPKAPAAGDAKGKAPAAAKAPAKK